MQQIIDTFRLRMGQVEKSFDEAIRLARSSTTRIEILDREATEIAAILEALIEISEQTNMLAINASLEAGRAGAEGARLAVVADEIRQLAGQTVLATEEIKRKIELIRNSTDQFSMQREDTI